MPPKILRLLSIAMAAFLLATPAFAHTISIGFTPGANAGEVTFWVGNYTHGSPGRVPIEGSLSLTGVNGTVFAVVILPFNLDTLVKPAALVDGTNNFYVSGPVGGVGFPLVDSDADFLTTCSACGPVTAWQGVTVSGLAPGDYQFEFIEAPAPTADWTEWNDSLRETLTLTRDDIPSADPFKPVCTGPFANGTFSGTATDNIPSEDVNGNSELDDGEDLNDNGIIDADTGIATIEMSADASNLSVVAEFEQGSPAVDFVVTVDNPSAPAVGKVIATDGAGNTCESAIIDLPFVHPANESNGWGEDVAVQSIGENLYAYVASGEAGAHVWNVTNPASPIFLSTEVPLPGSCEEVGGGFPAFYADAVKILQLSSLDFGSPIFTGDVAFFAAGACGLVIADIDDPLNVVQAAVFDTPSWAEAVDVYVDNVGETVNVYVASFWGGLRIYGQTNPLGDPTAFGEISSWGVNDPTVGPAIDLRVEQRGGKVLVHLLTDVGLRTVDVSDPLNPVAMSNPLNPLANGRFEFDPLLNESGEGMTIVGARAYIALWRGGLLVLDISDPTLPVEIETIPTDLAIYSVTTNSQGTRLYAAEGMWGVRTFTVDPSADALIERVPSPIDVAGGGWAWSLIERDRVLYISYGHLTDPLSGGFQIFQYAEDVACGLGFELAFLLPPILWLRNRRRRRA